MPNFGHPCRQSLVFGFGFNKDLTTSTRGITFSLFPRKLDPKNCSVSVHRTPEIGENIHFKFCRNAVILTYEISRKC